MNSHGRCQKTVCADDSIFTKTVLPVRSEVTAVMECRFRSLRNCISKKEYLQGDKGMAPRHLEVWLQYRLPRNSRCFSRLFREKPEFYGENPIAKRFGMGFSQATVHALDRACTAATKCRTDKKQDMNWFRIYLNGIMVHIKNFRKRGICYGILG